MKLPPFSEFTQARSEGKLGAQIDYDRYSLPPNPSHDQVVEFARRTAEYNTMVVMEDYHSWLSEQLATFGK